MYPYRMIVDARGRLAGKSAFVTGAGSGIGRATAELFAREGALVGVADLRWEEASLTVEAIRATGGSAALYQMDVANPAQVNRAVDTFVALAGSLDILINNAGIVVGGAAGELADADWSRNLDVNLSGAFYCCRAALPIMIARSSGAIVSVSSTSALNPIGERAGYASAKAGIYGLTRSIAVDYARHGIRANAVAPGAVATSLLLKGRLQDADVREAALRTIPMQRFGEPIELAQAILFLASSDASYITGQVLVVDGGATIP